MLHCALFCFCITVLYFTWLSCPVLCFIVLCFALLCCVVLCTAVMVVVLHLLLDQFPEAEELLSIGPGLSSHVPQVSL